MGDHYVFVLAYICGLNYWLVFVAWSHEEILMWKDEGEGREGGRRCNGAGGASSLLFFLR